MGKAAVLRKDKVVTNAAGRIRQAGALVWRPAQYARTAANDSGPAVEVLLLTSLNTGRWIIPKGWPKAGASFAESAADEAWEEAGVRGRVADKPIGSFDYEKPDRNKQRDFTIDVYEILMTEQASHWPEKDMRRRLWIAPQKAAALVDEPGLRALLKTFAPSLKP